MNSDSQQPLLLAQCQSMVILLDSRLGQLNPWRNVNLESYSASDLADVRKLMHELLYAPPSRSD